MFFGAGLLGGGAATSRASAPQASTAGSFSATPVSEKAGAVTPAVASGDVVAPTDGAPSDDRPTELKVRMYNRYTKDNGIELYPWEHMAEPHKPTTMELLDWPQADENLEYR